jgi:hypothetical protein
LLCFNIYHWRIAGPETAQLMAYGFRVAFFVEEFLSAVVGRPTLIAAVVPTGNPPVGSGSQCDAIAHCGLLPRFQKGGTITPGTIKTLTHLIRRHPDRSRQENDTLFRRVSRIALSVNTRFVGCGPSPSTKSNI